MRKHASERPDREREHADGWREGKGGRGAWKATDLGKEGEIEPKGDVVFFHSPFPS